MSFLKRIYPQISLSEQLGLFSNMSVLDVGCGKGYKLHCLGENLFKVGIDLVKRLEVKINFVKADATYLPFRNDMFDIVFANEVMSHVWNISKTLTEMSRVTRKVVFIKDTNFMSPLALLKLLRRLGIGWLATKRHPNRVSKHEDVHSVFWFKRKIGNSAEVVCGRRFNSRILDFLWKYFGNDVRIRQKVSHRIGESVK